MKEFFKCKHPITQLTILFLGSAVASAFFAYSFFESYVEMVWLGSTISLTIVAHLLLSLLDYFSLRFLKFRIHLFVLIASIYFTYEQLLSKKMFATPKTQRYLLIIGIAFFTLTMLLLLDSQKKRKSQRLLLALSIFITGSFYFVLLGEGFPKDARYQALGLTPQSPLLVDTSPSTSYTVSEFTGHNLDLEWLLKGDEKVNYQLREWVLGYGYNEIPIRGVLYKPEMSGKADLVVMIHGNHKMVTPSYLGYEYLGDYLASRGIAMLSLDQGMLNGYADNDLDDDNPARAIMLLEALKVLQEDEDISFENITLAGHSRGGEAIVIAASFNQMDYYPGHKEIAFDYHFDIANLFAIAPTYGQYPLVTQPKAVNYVAIHGAHDQDVTSFRAETQFNQIEVEANYLKSVLYVANFNHGQFNSTWGHLDSQPPGALNLNTANLLEQSDQERMVELMVYHLVQLGSGKLDDDILFTNIHALSGQLPKTWMSQQYFRGNNIRLYDFASKNLDYVKTTVPHELTKLTRRFGESTRNNQLLKVSVTDGSEVTFEINQENVDVISLDVTKEVIDDNFEIIITSLDGTRQFIAIDDIISPGYPISLSKWEVLFNISDDFLAFETIEIDPQATDIESMMLVFKGTNNYYFDNVSVRLLP